MAIDLVHYRKCYSELINEAIGGYKDRNFRALCAYQAGKGESMFLDNWRPTPETNAGLTAMASAYGRSNYEAETAGNKTWANWEKMRTPHQDIDRWRTLSLPNRIHTGHTFEKETEIALNANPQSQVNAGLAAYMARRRDVVFVNALKAASVIRGKEATSSTVPTALPNSQKITTTQNGYIDPVKDCAKIIEVFEKNEFYGAKPFVLISPATKRAIIDNSFETIFNKDFVSEGGILTGELPDIQGCRFIVTNLVGDDEFYAFVGSALTWVQYGALETFFDVDIGNCAQHVLYLREYIDCVRTDDLGVVHGTIAGAGSSSSSSSSSSSGA